MWWQSAMMYKELVPTPAWNFMDGMDFQLFLSLSGTAVVYAYIALCTV